MPPKAAASARSKANAFKPPRPVNPPAQSPKSKTSTKRPSATNARSGNASKKAAPSRGGFQAATTIISSDEEEDEEEENDAISESDNDAPNRRTSTANRTAGAREEETISPVPLPLLTRLLIEGFEDKGMRMQRGALELTGKYIETFVREAIARAQYERNDANRGGGISDGFLQVEDLEKLAPQLVLDF